MALICIPLMTNDMYFLFVFGHPRIFFCGVSTIHLSIRLSLLSIFQKYIYVYIYMIWGLPLVAQMVKNLPAVQETWVQPLGWGRSPREGNGNPLQDSCLENSVDRGAWWVIVHRVARVRHNRSTNTFTFIRRYKSDGRYLCCDYFLMVVASIFIFQNIVFQWRDFKFN